MSPPRDPKLTDLLASGVDLVTPEYEMKIWNVWSEEGRNDFAAANKIVEWARINRLRVRLHTPVFAGSGMPAWLDDIGNSDPQRGTEAVLAYVETLAAEYPDADAIDVVNEAIAEDGCGLIDHWFYRHGGYDAIADAFVIANETAPDAELVYNEQVLPHDHWVHPKRRQALSTLVEECRKRNAPVHTIGLQAT